MPADGALQSADAIMTPMRVGVVGCGRIGRMHAELLHRRVPGAAVAAVQDSVPEAASAVAGELRVPVVDTIDDVLALGVDAVAICTSTDTHVELIAAAATLRRRTP